MRTGERGTILEMADDEVTLRLPGLERLEMREEDRSVEPRDRIPADNETVREPSPRVEPDDWNLAKVPQESFLQFD